MGIATRGAASAASAAAIDVIVVDDDDHTREMIATVLSRNRCTVRQATNAEEALAAVAERVPDALVTALEPADVSGWAIAEVLRGDDKTHHVARVALTGSSPRREVLRAFDACLRKPLDEQLLVEVVEQFSHACDLGRPGRA